MNETLQSLLDHLATASRRKSIFVVVETIQIDHAAMTECLATRVNAPQFDEHTTSHYLASIWKTMNQLALAADGSIEITDRALFKHLWDAVKYVAIVEQDFERAAFIRDRQDWIRRRPAEMWLPTQVRMVCEGTVCAIEPLNPSEDTVQLLAKTRANRAEYLSQLIREVWPLELAEISFDPRWRTSDVVGLARAIYDDRAFERMPILADALMDAGCENEEIIGHCRGNGPHVRGCWVVDLILGKE